VIHSALGLGLVLIGGFRLFEKMMAACIGVMFITVISTAVMAEPHWASVGRGICFPSIPAGGLGWVLGILGGVGGTVTLLSYGYWIKEAGRSGVNGMRACRIDLTVGYAMTALFGVAMIIIGSKVVVSGSGANVAPLLADQLGRLMGPSGRLIFLLGFWGAVFSSLLGVWQGVPYLFADFLTMRRGCNVHQRQAIDYTKTASYRAYLIAMSIIPLPILFLSVKKAQLAYAVLGSLFMPLLALTLLLMNNRRSWVGERFRNGWIPNAVLSLVLIFFVYVGFTQATKAITMLRGM
jgi:Mn2+/Fe2+ NRAMP family transporter